VFDSGVGGLTVLHALRNALPGENFVYLGDTARLPYGTKSADSVVRYSLQCAGALVKRGIRCLVVACNTASSSALSALRSRYSTIPVIGVIEPGAAAASAASRTRHIAVIGTEGTIAGGAYQRAIHSLDPSIQVSATACSLFVALAEEGWVEGAIPVAVAGRYLDPIFHTPMTRLPIDRLPDVLVLGCTHFPILERAIRAVIPDFVRIVDSAACVAAEVARQLPVSAGVDGGNITWLATDGADRFARVGGIFLGETLRAEEIEIIDL
jgi:glutamate racemase